MQTHRHHPRIVHDHHDHNFPRPLMPPIPDLRYEQSFLKKLQPFVRFSRTADASEVVEIQWGHVFWLTVRDQVLAPLAQGTLLTILAFYFSPISSQFERSLRRRRRVIKEGLGVGWLRGWVQSLGLSTATTGR
ncbi:hypothetical protein L218DRAFT_1078475 [Marasmius fiardii PR-910]|nr:hypothetical protein L218DRAFT_1078475 [Marasmius fiardii PR-910]